MPLKARLRTVVRAIAKQVVRRQEHTLPERILAEYRNGRFPMMGGLGFIEWHAPDQRAIIPLDDRFLIGKRLRKKLDSGIFRVTFDTAFAAVLQGCAEPTPSRGNAWLTPELVNAYLRLHERGYAHSVEVWRDEQLVGGEYGVAIGGFYSGESAFTREDYASRVALVHLVARLRERGFRLLDSQVMNTMAREFGAYEVAREEYAGLLKDALSQDARFH